MPSFPINSFKFGLDTRRDVLTSVAGTLVTCENAHINPGGEIEKRKAFGDLAANTDVLDSNGAQGTFGLEVTDAGLVAFGSALNFGASVTQGQPTLASALVGVTYQQLQHPSLTNDSTETYNATYHRMTSLVFSENYNGKAFACALFSDGRRFLYYDGDIVQHSANGLVMEGRIAKSDLANDLLRQIEAVDWSGYANRTVIELTSITRAASTATATYTGHGLVNGDTVEILGATQAEYNGVFTVANVTANTFDYTVVGTPATPATGTPTATVLESGATLVKSPVADYFSAAPSETSTSGQLGFKELSLNNGGAGGAKATAAFQITGNSGTFTLTAPENSDGTGSVDLCDGAVSAKGTATETATAIAKAVNNLTYVHGYSANTNGDIVYVYANLEWGPFTPGGVTQNLTVTVTTGTVGSTITTPSQLIIQISPNPSRGGVSVPYGTGVNAQYTTGTVIAVGGGLLPYTYAFTELTEGSGNGITIIPTGSGNTFDSRLIYDVPITNRVVITGQFLVTVRDATSPTALVGTASITITFTFDVL